ncbi:cell division suppressor protein YneA [Alkaliphilus sp. B6464]|uniref:cell division suppressor protein YneA n=1 Tax=Alkaliphilus sp. B6464 TaxID=2731219 RepID=UPI001BA52090|nr:LysM peptidoglycan-binding domain-containing protein [Alkaliphilus sp. B6464]QUH22111.1 LysM peptidoglycan-binding domain-containing protein [Alkaliphilus sp. B6464]
MKKRIKLHNKFKFFRAIVILVLTIASISAISFRSFEVRANQNEFQNAKLVEYCVKKGDTLWTIASNTSFQNELDTRAIIDRIKEDNNLSSGNIYPGQVILIPKK